MNLRLPMIAALAALSALLSIPAAALELSGIAAITAGALHSCAITTSGAVKCWGSNRNGQLGDGTTTLRSSPVNVRGLDARAIAISAGTNHTCVVTADGGARCWGLNTSGQLGDATTTPHLQPIAVPGIAAKLVAISAGEFHTCALTDAGGVKCWGHLRAVGLASAPFPSPPVDVPGLTSGVVAISAGSNFTCALLSGGAVKCWGIVGAGGFGPQTPLAVSGLQGPVVAIDHGCMLLANGRSQCANSLVLAQESGNTVITTTDFADFGSGAVALAVSAHACAITGSGVVRCRGDNSSGQLGDGTLGGRTAVADVRGLSEPAKQVVVGTAHTCALLVSGHVRCWGNDGNGQLGDGFDQGQLTPVDVALPGTGVTGLAAGADHTCARDPGDAVRCWGHDDEGQLGDGAPFGIGFNPASVMPLPVPVAGLDHGVAAIAAGGAESCVRMVGGGIKCWGGPYAGDGSTVAHGTPVDVAGLDGPVASISVGGGHVCVVLVSGAVECWGLNDKGQLGRAGPAAPLPAPVAGLAMPTAQVAAGGQHTCALSTTGGVRCWGSNSKGQLGDGSTVDRATPVDVTGLSSGISMISAGSAHTCALTTAGEVRCWGDNSLGQLGDGSGTNRSTPVAVAGLRGPATMIAAGGLHTCALVAMGRLQCWGYNGFGQLGDGSAINRMAPVDVAMTDPARAMTLGTQHTCAEMLSGVARCWGYGYFGQIGNGKAGTQRISVAVTLAPGSRVIEFFNATLDHFFITADSDEAAAVDAGAAGPGWIRTGGAFNAGGDVDVCRFYGSQSPGPNSHFYSLDGSECQGLIDAQFPAGDPRRASVKAWNFESFDFSSTRPAGSQCPAGMQPIYRAYNNGFARGIDSNHRITADPAAINAVVARGWLAEGVVMCAPL